MSSNENLLSGPPPDAEGCRQAFHYSAFAISSLITPSIQNYVASKWILTMASVLFAVYYLGFIHVNYIYFYVSQALMGIGYSC